MKYSQSTFPKFSELKGKDRVSYIWNYLFINNSLIWRISSLSFRMKCGLLGIKCKHVRTYGKVDIYRAPKSNIFLGENISITSKSSRGNACLLYGRARLRTLTPLAKIIIGNNTGMNGMSITARSKSIRIADNCRIGPNVVIVDSDFHALMPAEVRKTSPGFEFDRDVIINENVWIGMNTTILKGVTIGKNSIIGAGSVVVKDIEENCIAAGVPAKKVKSLI